MAVVNPPAWLQNSAAHTAKLFRRALGGILASEGVAAYNTPSSFGLSGDLAVVQRAAGANMSVDIARGGAYILGDDATDQGYYFFYNDAVVNVAVTAADPVNSRIDLVIARVKDAAEGGAAGDTSTLEIVQGTPAGSPVAPALPATSYKLAQIAVGAGVTSITNANITSFRAMATTSLFEKATPSVKVYRTLVQAIPDSVITNVIFSTANATEAWDTDNLHNLGSNPTRLSVPSGLDGKWLVQGGIEFNVGPSNERGAYIYKNGSIVAQVVQRAVAIGVTPIEIQTTLQLNSGDYVELAAWQTSGSPVNVPASNFGEGGTWFGMTRIG